jgi:thiamine biosynthesis lipoprotein
MAPQLLSSNALPYGYVFAGMGTSCSLNLFADSRHQADMLAALAVSEIERIERKYSRYKFDSALSVMNRAAGNGEIVTVDDETAGLLNYAFACHKKSGGLFDITAGVLRRAWNFHSGKLPDPHAVEALLPLIGIDKLIWEPPNLSYSVPDMELDFGGFGKEYAADRLAALLADEGMNHALIDLGGDFFALGPQIDGAPWSIGLRDPYRVETIMHTVALSQGALTTSGDYARSLEIGGRRYSHILNPRTGWPVQGLASVTALAPQCMVAGSVTTIAMLKGRDGIEWLSNLALAHLWVDENGTQGGSLLRTLSVTS